MLFHHNKVLILDQLGQLEHFALTFDRCDWTYKPSPNKLLVYFCTYRYSPLYGLAVFEKIKETWFISSYLGLGEIAFPKTSQFHDNLLPITKFFSIIERPLEILSQKILDIFPIDDFRSSFVVYLRCVLSMLRKHKINNSKIDLLPFLSLSLRSGSSIFMTYTDMCYDLHWHGVMTPDKLSVTILHYLHL